MFNVAGTVEYQVLVYLDSARSFSTSKVVMHVVHGVQQTLARTSSVKGFEFTCYCRMVDYSLSLFMYSSILY